MIQETKMKPVAALVLGLCSTYAAASGFQLQNQNGAGTGVAYAGAAAVAEDASTIFFNPAGMTYLSEGSSISAAGTLLNRSVHFSNKGTTPMPVINPATGAPTGAFHPIGSDGGDGGGLALIPAGFYSYAISPALRVGVGISATYGSETEYDPGFAGRFSGRYTSIHQININPSVAYKVNDMVSLGFGLNYAKNEIKFKQATPFISAAGLGPEGILEGDDDAWGYNLGAMFQISPSTRIGLAYRSAMKFHLEGKQRVDALGVDRAIRAQLETPDNFSMAVSQKLSDRWEMLGDITWTGWSSVKALTAVSSASGAAVAAPLRYNMKDSYRVGLGAKYQVSEALSLRFGTAYDQSPVPNAESRTMTVPDSDRTWLSVGARWNLSKASSLDVGYAHIFFKDTSTNRAVTNTAETATLQTVRGDFKTSADLLSMQYNMNF